VQSLSGSSFAIDAPSLCSRCVSAIDAQSLRICYVIAAQSMRNRSMRNTPLNTAQSVRNHCVLAKLSLQNLSATLRHCSACTAQSHFNRCVNAVESLRSCCEISAESLLNRCIVTAQTLANAVQTLHDRYAIVNQSLLDRCANDA
jgi:hypothetical protein